MKRLSLIAAVAAASLAGPALSQDAGHAGHASPAAHHDHHADFESGRFHVRLSGTEGAPDLILIPGNSSSPHVFDALDEALGDRFRIHALHVQGMAGAPVEDNASGPVVAPVAEELARYIREAGLEKPAVIGHSMGGTVGMMLATRHPDLVDRLMVVDMLPFMGVMYSLPGSNPTAESVAPTADATYTRLTTGPEDAYLALLRATVTTMVRDEAGRAVAIRDAETSDRQVSASVLRDLIGTDLRADLPNFTGPVSVLYVPFTLPGFTPEITDAVYQSGFSTLPEAKLTRIDDSAHFIMFDQPERFQAEVEAFLAN